MRASFTPVAFKRSPAFLPANSSSCPMCIKHPSCFETSNPELIEITGRTVIQVAVGFSGSRFSGVSDYQPKWVAQLTVSDHGDLRLDLGNNRERENTKRDACDQREDLHTDHRIILHAPHERYSADSYDPEIAAEVC